MTFSFSWYEGKGKQKGKPVSLPLPQSRRTYMANPEHYRADTGLRDACNVALFLGQPLLLTGEPGTGKTRFAYNLAWELGLGEPLKFETKSDSIARDLFYTYDALRHYQHIQTKGHSDTLSYLRYGPLGIAILRANALSEVEQYLPPEQKETVFQPPLPRRSVVLIDEIDKSPRDFPNDMLNELELMYFRIPELDNVKVEGNPYYHPIVVITSNSEKELPDAFLRRCIYYHIPFPDKEGLKEIISLRLGKQDTADFLDDAISLFQELREGGLQKKPATAELIGWMGLLQDMSKNTPNTPNPLSNPEQVERTLSTLIKTEEDRKRAKHIVENWFNRRKG